MSTTMSRVGTDASPRTTTTDPEHAASPLAPPQPAPAPATAVTPVATPDPVSAVHRLLSTLRSALAAVAELDPDALSSRAPAGRAAVPLAGTARSAVAALGGNPGSVLAHAPGIVVGRDLVMATSLLDDTARRRGARASAAARLADLAAEADRCLAELLRAVTPRG